MSHDALDEILPQRERQDFEAHLRECAECQRVWNELQCTRLFLRRLPRAPMPDPMKQKILHALRRRTPSDS